MYFLQLLLPGVVDSAILGLLGAGIVVVYRGSGVPNFAAGAVGMISAYAFYKMYPSNGVPWPILLICALVIAAAMGAAMHLVLMRRLRNSSLAMKMIATLGVQALLLALADQYFAPNGSVSAARSFLPGGQVKINSKLSISTSDFWVVGIVVAVILGLMALQKFSRFGLATSAVAEDETVAAGMGWSPDVVASLNWAVGSAVGALSMILLAPISGLTPETLTLFVIPALGAALVGHFDSFPLLALGALIIGVGTSETGMVTTAPGWSETFPLLVIIVYLMLRGQAIRDRSESGQRMPSVGPGKLRFTGLVVTIAMTVVVLMITIAWVSPITTSMMLGLVLLSVVVLTGYAGQLSLAQYGLAGVSAFMSALFATRYGLPMFLAIILAVIVTTVAGMVLATPALRTRGASLAIVTLSLVTVIEDLLLDNPTTANWFATNPIPDLRLFGIDFSPVAHPRTYAILVLVVLSVFAVLVVNLRRSTMGRRMLAIRANPQAAASIGVSPTMTKLYAFGVAAFIAGVCGALTESQLQYPDFSLFSLSSSINVVLNAVVGGVGWVAGGIAVSVGATSGVLSHILSYLFEPSNWLSVITGALAVLIVLHQPDGIGASMHRQMGSFVGLLRRLASDQRSKKPRVTSSAFQLTAQDAVTDIADDPNRPAPAALHARGITVSFGGTRALDGVSLLVNPGEVVGLIGPNGAGKSTFIDAVCGVVRTSSGEVYLGKKALKRMSPTRRAKHGVVRSFQSLELFEDMSVGENMSVSSSRPRWSQGVTDLFWPRQPKLTPAAVQAIRDFELQEVLDVSPRSLDHGRRRLLAITRVMAAMPSVILLDEPAAGLDSTQRRELGQLLRKVANEWDIGILLVEHDVNMVFTMCDRVVALVGGKVITEGSPEVVRRNEVLLEAYLGHRTVVDATRSDTEAGAELGKIGSQVGLV